MDVDFSKLKLNGSSMFTTYKVLACDIHSMTHKMEALATLSVTVSEGTRLRFLQRRVFHVFSTRKCQVVDNDSDDPASDHIQEWGKDCERVMKGLQLKGLAADAAEEETKNHTKLLKDLGIIKWSLDQPTV
jgi:hypothetical protein